MSNTIVRTNVMSLNSHRNLGLVGNQQNRASQRLSSGFRINSAADDAAGLGISEKMRAQIRGLDQASRNGQDGISLIQTAEGAMSTINEMVIRIRELVVQAANDTNAHDSADEATWSQSDRTRIQAEINQLMDEIDATRNRVEFNTRTLLDGTLGSGSTDNGGGAPPPPPPSGLPDRATLLTAFAGMGIVADTATQPGLESLVDAILAEFENGTFERGVDFILSDDLATGTTEEVAAFNALRDWVAAEFNPAQPPPDVFTSPAAGETALDDLFDVTMMSTMHADQQTAFMTWLGSANARGTGEGSIWDLFNGAVDGPLLDDLDDATVAGWLDAFAPGGAAFMVGNEATDTTLGLTVNDIRAFLNTNREALNAHFEAGSLATFDISHLGTGFTRNDIGTTTGTGTAGAVTNVGTDNVLNDVTDVLATWWNNAFGENAASSGVDVVEEDGDENGNGTPAPPAPTHSGPLWFQVGANTNQGVRLSIEDVGVDSLSAVGYRSGHENIEAGFTFANLRTRTPEEAMAGETGITSDNAESGVMRADGEDIQRFLTAIDFALSHVTEQRSNLGAMQNRLEFTIENLDIASENLSAANSRIRDADMAQEMMRLTQANVLQQAAISMLAQANQAPQSVLQLLG